VLEDAAPPRFAQGVGLVFTVVALVGYLSGATLLGAIATGFALAAAFLNAVFGFCLGCEVYLLARRLAPISEKNAAGSPVAN
jgi:zinc transporter ZupT